MMHPIRLVFLFVFAVVVLTAGCRTGDDAPPPEEEPVEEDPTAGLPEEKIDTLQIEGQSEPVTLQLYRNPDLPVVTYVPEGDFDAQVVGSSEGMAIHFTATFGGVRNEDASMRLFFPSEFSNLNDPAQLQALVEEPDGIAEIEGFALQEATGETPCPRAEHAWTIRPEADRTGFMCISSRGERWFLVIAAYPIEYSEGFGPRAAIVLRELQWREQDEEPVEDPV